MCPSGHFFRKSILSAQTDLHSLKRRRTASLQALWRFLTSFRSHVHRNHPYVLVIVDLVIRNHLHEDSFGRAAQTFFCKIGR